MNIKSSAPEGDTAEAVEFLNKMFDSAPRHLVAIDNKGRVEAESFASSDENDMANWIDERQGEANLYFHVNELNPGVVNKKASKDDVRRALSAHVDIDRADAEARLAQFPLKPTAVVHSGGGLHAYWRLATPTTDLDRVEQINRSIAAQVGGDNCHNIDRIMRLPGTVNLPNAKKRAAGRVPVAARLVSADWELSYSLDDFPVDDGPPPAGPKGAVAKAAAIAPIVPVALDTLPAAVTEATRQLVLHGDDAERPMGTEQPRFRSRSEAVFRVACDLARAGCAEDVIAGILINPEYAISASVLDKKAPQRYALKQAHSAWATIENGWPDVRRDGNPAPTMRNAAIALQRLGLTFVHDLFRHRKVVNGSMLAEHEGEISDDACALLRSAIIDTFNFDPKAENVRDAVTQLCLEHTFHPIREMLNTLVWDGIPRLHRWLSTYLGAPDNELNRAIGAITLIAAVRRVRQPGVKFDTIVILEGKQGTGKSTALQILAGPGNHSDNEILTLSTKEQMEAMEGVWIFEIGEISGLSKAEVERTKAFASRQSDKSRMSYGRFSERRERQVIFVGTTNDDKYLRDRTGNRRFLPVRTGVIELEALRRDRDQLLAEAAVREAQGDEITLPQELWADAAAEQEDRVEEDPWLEKLASLNGKAHGDEARLHSSDLLGTHLGIETERQHSGHAKRLTALMRSLGWEPAKFKVGGKTLRGFRRPKPDDHRDDQEF